MQVVHGFEVSLCVLCGGGVCVCGVLYGGGCGVCCAEVCVVCVVWRRCVCVVCVVCVVWNVQCVVMCGV